MPSSNIDPAPRPAGDESPATFSPAVVQAAIDVCHRVSANILFAYANAVPDLALLRRALHPPTKLVLVCRNEFDLQRARAESIHCISVPPFDLTRMDQIKMSTLIAFSQDILRGGDVFVFLTGVAGRSIDALVVMQVGREYELFHSVGQPSLTEHIRRAVFGRVLRLALELAHEGREGKPVGTLFVIGDHRAVTRCCQESRINPFRGYAERERNILDDSMQNTVKELAKLDGAFVIKGNGVIVSAGTTLRPGAASPTVPRGLGSRHSAAAGITAATRSIAITLSESTGTVRIWRRGAMITEIDKTNPAITDTTTDTVS
jgi:diadenylate cyclase